MKALSIKQPWAWCIVTGRKDVENRDWPTKYRGPILIHAGKSFDSIALDWLKSGGMIPKEMTRSDFDLGGIVGKAEIVDCVTDLDSKWFFGRYGFVMNNAEELPFIPYKGQLGFFNVDLPGDTNER